MFTGLESPSHIILLLLIILLLFGAKRLPEMGRNLGKGIKEFKEGLNTKVEPEEKRPPEAIQEGEEKDRAEEIQDSTQQRAQGKEKATHTKDSG
jgi:sec-independent protein translocase protein TatA